MVIVPLFGFERTVNLRPVRKRRFKVAVDMKASQWVIEKK